MSRRSRREALSVVSGVLVALSFARCNRHASADARCAQCGMVVAPTSRFRCGGSLNGRALLFDAPRCLFRYRLTAEGRALREPWVIEYYGPTERRTDAQTVRYVSGSDVIGPMGPDLVPVAPESVARFRQDHGGREAVSFEQVDEALLRSLR